MPTNQKFASSDECNENSISVHSYHRGTICLGESQKYRLIFNLENNIFQVVGVKRFTPSLHHFPLDIWKPGGSFHMKKPQGMLLGKFEFNSYGRLMWAVLLHS